MKNFINLTYRILYHIFNIILNVSLKQHGEKDPSIFQKDPPKNPSIRLYVNKIENIITFKIKRRYCLELLTPEMMKLLRSTEKNDKNKDGHKNCKCKIKYKMFLT